MSEIGEVGAPAAEVTESVTTPESVTEAPAAEPSEPSEPTYTIKVDGQEHQVTLEEALKGHMRQADYTRKTQELAEQRQALARAESFWNMFNQNPQGLVAQLYQELGLGQQQQPQVDEYADPRDLQIQELQSWRQQQEAAAQQAQIDQTLAQLHTRYGEFNDQDLFLHALQNNIPNLEVAYQSLAWQRAQAAEAEKTRQQQLEAAALEAKQRAGQLVSTAKSVQPSASQPAPRPFATFSELAMRIAKEQGYEVR